MSFWPFRPKKTETFAPAEVRTRLIEAAASGSQSKLRSACEKYKGVVAAHLDEMTKAPEEIRSDAEAIENYIPLLGAVAQCLASQCSSPQLLDKLCGTPESNPMLRWEKWFGELPQRAKQLEHTILIGEAKEFIEEVQHLEGKTARLNEAYLHGRLGELLLHSGRAAEAVEPFRSALRICRDINDGEGCRVYLGNLLEVHRYLGETEEAVRAGEEMIGLLQEGAERNDIKRRVSRITAGEPLCRVVCCRDGKDVELDEIQNVSEGRYDFEFRRNRLTLQVPKTLVRHGNELASSGKLADALEKLQAAMDTDPYDPDPVYQSGMCLLELGAYGKAREAFEEVERLAPGWFRCRSDRWLAESLETGAVTDEEFRLLRALEDGGISPEKAMPLAEKALAKYPLFAPFYLILGNLYQNQGEKDRATPCYKKGLALAGEPDIESRLLCALAGILPKESAERKDLVQRAVGLKGSLVAQAVAKVLGVS